MTSTDNTVIDYVAQFDYVVNYSIGSHFISGRLKNMYVHDFDCLFSDKHCIIEL